MADPVAWTLIDRGWDVVGSDGAELGKIDSVAGDEDHDIFDGIVVSRGLLRGRRYVPAEQVTQIVEGRVTVTLSKDGFERLGDYSEPQT